MRPEIQDLHRMAVERAVEWFDKCCHLRPESAGAGVSAEVVRLMKMLTMTMMQLQGAKCPAAVWCVDGACVVPAQLVKPTSLSRAYLFEKATKAARK